MNLGRTQLSPAVLMQGVLWVLSTDGLDSFLNTPDSSFDIVSLSDCLSLLHCKIGETSRCSVSRMPLGILAFAESRRELSHI